MHGLAVIWWKQTKCFFQVTKQKFSCTTAFCTRANPYTSLTNCNACLRASFEKGEAMLSGRSALIHFLGAIRTSSSETLWVMEGTVQHPHGPLVCVFGGDCCFLNPYPVQALFALLSTWLIQQELLLEDLADFAGWGWHLPHTFWWLYCGVAALASQGHDQLGLEKLQLFPNLWSLPWDQPFSKTNLALERQNLIDFQVQIQKGNDSCLFCSCSKDAASMFLRCQNY